MHPCERALLKHYASAKSSRRGKSSAAARGFIPAGGGANSSKQAVGSADGETHCRACALGMEHVDAGAERCH